MNELALFAGAGGGILGGHLLGWRTVCAVEWEPYAASVLAQRQNDGLLPPFPIWDDVRTFDGRPWGGRVDVVSGGFPCQDISVAGKGAGITGERSGLWSQMARIVGEVRPRYVFVENSPALLTRGLGIVLGDLAALGYDCRWTVLGASDVGAPHQRDRFWLVSHAMRDGSQQPQVRGEHPHLGNRPAQAYCTERREVADAPVSSGADVAYANGVRELQPQGRERYQRRWPCDCGADVSRTECDGRRQVEQSDASRARSERPTSPFGASDRGWWLTEPNVGRVADGVAARVDRLKAIGNGQVPQCAAAAWRVLCES
jgi:DNA (cytosine-5)-methyltransferase 1